MLNRTNSRMPIFVMALALGTASTAWSALKAFPSAEGFGVNAVGGRGGEVYHVTNLGDSGPGSFRDAASQPNRTIVFDVGGTIRLKSRVFILSNTTIAGQTAPGDGITLAGGGLYIGGSNNSVSHNVIMRHIRVRIPSGLKQKQTLDQLIPATNTTALAAWAAEYGGDGISLLKGSKMVFDHVSISWGADGNFDVNTNFKRDLDSITIQNAILSHGRLGHSTGGLMQTVGHVSVLRSLFANNWTRNPKVTCNNQFVNNVIYNWGASSYNFGGADYATKSNVTNNYMISGQGGTRPGIMGGDSFVTAYIKGNYWDKNRNGVLDGRDTATQSDSVKLVTKPFAFPAIAKEMTAPVALEYVLKNAGASRRRDVVDSNVVKDVQSYGLKGHFIRTEDSLPFRGLPTLKSGTAPTDTDRDGMPDAWETAKGLNKNDPLDRNNTNLSVDGYTNLEMYLNELAGDAVVYKGQGSLTSVIVNPAEMIGRMVFTPVSRSGIQKVEFWKNGVLECSDNAYPYQCQDTVSVATSYNYEARVYVGGAIAYRTKATMVMPFAYGLRTVRTPNELYASFNLPAGFTKGKALTLKVTSGTGSSWTQSYTGGVPGTQRVKFGVKFARKYTGNFVMQIMDGNTSLTSTSFTIIN